MIGSRPIKWLQSKQKIKGEKNDTAIMIHSNDCIELQIKIKISFV